MRTYDPQTDRISVDLTDYRVLHVGDFTITPVTRDFDIRKADPEEPIIGYHVSGPGLCDGWTYAYQSWAIDAAKTLAKDAAQRVEPQERS